MRTEQMNSYLGVVTKVIDPDQYIIEFTVPGVMKDKVAYPRRGEVDEPKVKDLIMVTCLDHKYETAFLYQKLKENEFIGFRSRGKKVDINLDRIEVGIFGEVNEKDTTEHPYPEYTDEKEKTGDGTPKSTSWIRIDKEGDLVVFMEGYEETEVTKYAKVTIGQDCTVKIGGNCNVTIDGEATITVAKDCKIDVNGEATITSVKDCTVKAPNVKVTGGSLETVNGGTCAPTGTGGFCGLPFCAVTGAPHSGPKITGT